MITVEYTYSEDNPPSEVIVYNSTGYMVHRSDLTGINGQESLDLTRLKSGEYFVTIISDGIYTIAKPIILK